MKRVSFLSFTKKKNVNEIVKEMESVEIQHQRIKLKKILTERKNKLKELISKKQISQPKMNYLPKNGKSFSFIESNASKEPFVSQKVRRRKFESDRVFSSSPNMRIGHSNSIQNQGEVKDKTILNQKFMEYDRIIDTQSGLRKIQALRKLSESLKYEYPRRKNADFKKTYFQKVVLDKYNFYSTNDYTSIRSNMLGNNDKTDKKEMKSQEYVLSKLKSVTTIDSSIRDKEYSTLENSALKKSRAENKKLSSAHERVKHQISIRSRIKTQGSEILPIPFQKNLDCINNY